MTTGSHVAVMLRNVPEFPLTWLALGRLGAVIVPVNPASTARELDYVATKSEASHIVIDVQYLRTFCEARAACEQTAGRVISACGNGAGEEARFCLEAQVEEAVGDDVPALDIDPDTLLNIQFTSGSTGLPKGCMLTHRYWLINGFVLAALSGSPQRLLADRPFFYLPNQAYLVQALWSGARLVVVPGPSRSRFLGWIDEYAIDFAWYVDILATTSPELPDVARTLKFVPSSGVHGETHARAEREYRVTIRDWYASTEVGPAVCVPAERGDLMARPLAIGLAAPFRETRIVDDGLCDVPPGIAGELCVRGPGMMLGYYNEPVANATAFFDGGWFRTGDLCTEDADGCHFILGRLSDSIRRSGESVSALEVEAALRRIPCVEAAAVIGVPDADRGQEVKAYLVVAPECEADADIESIFAACREQLAPFKIPRYIEFRTEFAMTASGKIAKNTLREEKSDLTAGAFDRVRGRWNAA